MDQAQQVTLKCPVTIKAKVTENLKKQLTSDIEEAIKRADTELQQIDFQGKRALAEQAKQDAQGLVGLRQQINAEMQKRIDFKAQMEAKLKETTELEIGVEIVQGTLEQFVTLGMGDDLNQAMSTEILLEDGKIIALRS
ncbi:ribosomal protein S6 [Sporomusaceae bacterium BoRhaA]|uniref:YlqD family protein n=1 Tax=Pelorhabdus rhamnosifermentans TaxID=2772457 RepID=UPI001C062FB0|nr:YlqD family protein [Pelorhabdus rhamnosifermentans]MBU2701223.1 ribosomal protein S6 [Pelorhabdus rhamnosifermentans]